MRRSFWLMALPIALLATVAGLVSAGLPTARTQARPIAEVNALRVGPAAARTPAACHCAAGESPFVQTRSAG